MRMSNNQRERLKSLRMSVRPAWTGTVQIKGRDWQESLRMNVRPD